MKSILIIGLGGFGQHLCRKMAEHEFDEHEHLMVIGKVEGVERLLKNFENEKVKVKRKW